MSIKKVIVSDGRDYQWTGFGFSQLESTETKRVPDSTIRIICGKLFYSANCDVGIDTSFWMKDKYTVRWRYYDGTTGFMCPEEVKKLYSEFEGV